jgi:hypothetical protein
MPRPSRVMYSYQVELLNDVLGHLRRGENVYLRACVGSGKTLISLVAAMVLLKERVVDRVLFIAPTSGIVSQTRAGYSGTLVDFGAGVEVFPRFYGHETEWDVRSEGKDALIHFLETDAGNAYGTENARPIFVDTYNCFRDSEQAQKEAQRLGSRLLIIVDEAQHAPGAEDSEDDRTNKIARVLINYELILRMGGTDRPDRQDIPGHRVARPLGLHMSEGFTPHPLEVQVLEVEGSGDEDTPTDDFFGVPKNQTAAIQTILAHHEREGCPKAILRIKASGNQNRHQNIVSACRRTIEERGRSYVDGTDAAGDDGSVNLNRYLSEKEGASTSGRRAPYSDLEDFLLVLRRGDEGIDPVSRSHLYILGVPRSPELLEQLIGRVLRLRIDHETKQPKIAGYPERWLTTSKVVFVVPKEQSEAVTHLVLGSTLYISALSKDVALMRELRIDDGFGGRPEPRTLPRLTIDHARSRHIRTLLEGLQCVMLAHPHVFRSPKKPTAAQAEQMALLFAKSIVDSHASDTRLQQAAEEVLKGDSTDIRRVIIHDRLHENADLRRQVQERINEQRKLGRSWNDSFDEAINLLLPEFREEVWEVDTHHLTSAVIERYGQRLIDLVCNRNTPRTHDELRRRVQTYVDAHDGCFPLLTTADPESGCFFKKYDQQLRAGQLGDKLAGGLGDLFVRSDWQIRLHGIGEEIMGRRTQVDPSTAGNNPNRYRTLTGLTLTYQRVPEMVYFPHAWKACQGDEVSWGSIAEAHEVGSRIKQ